MTARRLLPLVLVALCASLRPAAGDKIDDLTRALMQDPSYKVRVQAALVLGKLGDKRSVPALMQALRDENETVRGVSATSLGRIGDRAAAAALQTAASGDASDFVRAQAKQALTLVANLATSPSLPSPRAGARFYLTVGFGASKAGAQYAQMVREALTRELQKLPAVTLSVGGGGEPSAAMLSQKHLDGYIVDGSIQRLSAAAGQIDCDLKAFVATYPGKSIKMMTTAGASLQAGGGPSEELSAKRECLFAAAEAVREDVGKFLKTLE